MPFRSRIQEEIKLFCVFSGKLLAGIETSLICHRGNYAGFERISWIFAGEWTVLRFFDARSVVLDSRWCVYVSFQVNLGNMPTGIPKAGSRIARSFILTNVLAVHAQSRMTREPFMCNTRS